MFDSLPNRNDAAVIIRRPNRAGTKAGKQQRWEQFHGAIRYRRHKFCVRLLGSFSKRLWVRSDGFVPPFISKFVPHHFVGSRSRKRVNENEIVDLKQRVQVALDGVLHGRH